MLLFLFLLLFDGEETKHCNRPWRLTTDCVVGGGPVLFD